MTLSGKTALVTAAGQGIGRATALAFAKAGAKVYATDVNEALLSAYAGEASITTRKVDVLKSASINDAVAEIGTVDILFNCAGFVHSGTILEASDEDLDFAYDLNVKSWCGQSARSCRECWSASPAPSSTCRRWHRASPACPIVSPMA